MQKGNNDLRVLWSKKALNGYRNITEYLLENFTIKEVEKLQNEINSLLINISQFGHICPTSKKGYGLHKCTLLKKTSLVYRTQKNELQIVALFDNRKKHPY